MLQAIQRLPDWEFYSLFILSLWAIQSLAFYCMLVSMWGKPW